MGIALISRNDDFGSSHAANRAILEAARCGYITRNVSCMAPAPYIAEAAEELKKYKHIAIGMHATLNSEWDGIRWGALTANAHKHGFAREDGSFYASQQELAAAGPDIDAILKEYDAQLDLLTKLGLPISYVDSHMFPEYFIPELYEAFGKWIAAKGLIDAEDYYYLSDPLSPETKEDATDYMAGLEKWLAELTHGQQYFYLAHPACDSEESLLMYNKNIPKGAMRLERSMEHLAVTSPRWEAWMKNFDITPVRYTEAKKVERGAFERRIL